MNVWNNALADYTMALSIQPNHLDALNNRGVLYCKQGRRELGLTDFRQATTSHPEHPQAWFNMGIVLFELGRFEESLRCFDTVVDLDRSLWEKVRPFYFEASIRLNIKQPE